jgi:hypothetical protein
MFVRLSKRLREVDILLDVVRPPAQEAGPGYFNLVMKDRGARPTVYSVCCGDDVRTGLFADP